MPEKKYAYWEYDEPYPEEPMIISESEILKTYRPFVEELAARVNKLPVSDADVIDNFIVNNWAWEVKDDTY